VLIPSNGAPFIYRFEDFELDPARFELRKKGARIHIEPQVLSVLIVLASNADRLVSKDELIEKVWDGRFISDAAVAARIKSARRALDDDGAQQRIIRTVHGKGLRFVAKVSFVHEPSGTSFAPQAADFDGTDPVSSFGEDGRPSIAILPFRQVGAPGPLSFLRDALADELIADLSRLRWLLVIARGSSFRFRGPNVDIREAGSVLNVAYCLNGSIEEHAGAVTIAVEMARTRDGGVVWAERFSADVGELWEVRHEIVTAIVANLEVRIPQHEAQQARRKEEGALEPWAAYHLGLDLMFRFNRSDNAHAARLFEQALGREPEFARALGGLSFTRFQDAFLQYTPDPATSAEEAYFFAERALQCDPLDAFAYLNFGRSLWLQGQIDESIGHLDASIRLNPNYSQAIYSKAWAEMTRCEAAHSDENATLALRLSPLDPLRYAMLGVRSVNALVQGDYEGASTWGERAASSPGAHKHIALIAALGAQAAGQRERAAWWVSRAKSKDPAVDRASFLRSFPFAPSSGRALIEATLRDLGL
jgi:TolB-like protein/cytochrome c-type biogenesis protein CcmH/NrfG